MAGFLLSGPLLRAFALVLLLAALLSGGFLALRHGVPHLIARAEHRHPLDAARVRIVFQRAPSWIPQEDLDALGDEVRAALAGGGTIAPDALAEAHATLLQSGWFDRIEQVRRSGPAEILVSAEFRVPFALVRSNGFDHVVDQRYRRLPLAYAIDSERPPLPLVLNVRHPRPAEPGAPWSGQDVRAAIHLARLVRDRAWFTAGAVDAIDARRFERERLLELIGEGGTQGGTRIIWGCDPEERSLAEMPALRKIECLDALWRSTRRLDDGTGRPLDLRFDAVTLAATTPR